MLSVWAPDVHAVPATSALRQFLVAIGVVVLVGSTIYAATPEKPALPRVRCKYTHHQESRISLLTLLLPYLSPNFDPDTDLPPRRPGH